MHQPSHSHMMRLPAREEVASSIDRQERASDFDDQGSRGGAGPEGQSTSWMEILRCRSGRAPIRVRGRCPYPQERLQSDYGAFRCATTPKMTRSRAHNAGCCSDGCTQRRCREQETWVQPALEEKIDTAIYRVHVDQASEPVSLSAGARQTRACSP
jgi:hypothetical protein